MLNCPLPTFFFYQKRSSGRSLLREQEEVTALLPADAIQQWRRGPRGILLQWGKIFEEADADRVCLVDPIAKRKYFLLLRPCPSSPLHLRHHRPCFCFDIGLTLTLDDEIVVGDEQLDGLAETFSWMYHELHRFLLWPQAESDGA